MLEGDLAEAPLGTTVTIRVPDREASDAGALRVPLAALFDAGKGPGVWFIHGTPAKVSWRPVAIQQLDDDSARIVGPLRQGDRVVALGAHLLREGERVRVADQPSTVGGGQ